MVDGIGLALGSLKSVSDLAKSLIELRDTAKVGEIAIELQGKIAAAQQLAIAAQQEQSTLVKEIDDLKQKVVRFETWESEKQRYELQKMRDDDEAPIAYLLKDSMANGQPPHWICVNCYENREKSILQPVTLQALRTLIYACQSCGADYVISGERPAGPPPKVIRKRPSSLSDLFIVLKRFSA